MSAAPRPPRNPTSMSSLSFGLSEGAQQFSHPSSFVPPPCGLRFRHRTRWRGILLSQGAGRCGREGMAFAHIYAQSKRVVTSNAAPFTRIQMGACSSFPVIDWASETCAPVDRGHSVSQSMRHPLEILRSPTSARPFYNRAGRVRRGFRRDPLRVPPVACSA